MSGPEQRVCIFCGGRPLTKTHIIAQRAIRRFLPRTGAGIDRVDIWPSPHGPNVRTRKYPLDPLGQHVKRACDPCNRVWMGAIENDAASDVIQLALGDRTRLEEEQRSRVALWATVVAMLRTTQDPGDPTFDPEDARSIRRTSKLPAGYVVWLMRGTPRWDFPSRHQRLLIGPSVAPSHVTWFWIGQAVFMVTHPLAAGLMSRMNVLGDAVEILAPYGPDPVEWPIRTSVTFESLVNLTSTLQRR